MSKNDSNNIANIAWEYASTECQQLLLFCLEYLNTCAIALTYNQGIGHLYVQKW